ncbi:MAG: hypothetical protein P4M09_17045 [Devosia sp.]|nr:hypothetical protein [Devosia sp.]
MPKSVLALDVSSVSTGWAFGRVGEKPLAGMVRFAPKGALDDEIWLAAMRWLTDRMNVLNPDVVAIEAAIMTSNFDEEGRPKTNPRTQGLLWGLQSILRTVVKAKKPSPAKLVNVSSARKLFTGKGTYPKGQAKPAVKRRAIELGWLTPEDATEDKADACCIFAKACADIDPAFAANFTLLGTAKSNVVRLIPSSEEMF